MSRIILTEDNYITVLAMLNQRYKRKKAFTNCKFKYISLQKNIEIDSVTTIESKFEYKDSFIQTIVIKTSIVDIEIEMGDSICFLPFGITVIHKQNGDKRAKIKLSRIYKKM